MKNPSEVLRRANWPEAISDGLTLPCSICGEIPKFDYRVKDSLWRRVVPEAARLGVVCLPCFDFLASKAGVEWASNLEEVQFTGIGITVVLSPTQVYDYRAIALAEAKEK